jgi:septum formation protein
MQIILASSSPRRRELLSALGMPFEVIAPDIDETLMDGEKPVEFCIRASYDKAHAIAQHHTEAIVLGADTVVVVDNTVLGKPENKTEAAKFLTMLQGRSHDVFTGYSIIEKSKEKSISKVIHSKVYFRDMTAEEISWYISTGEPMDKAGAYGLQGIGALFVDKIEGSYTNVIGLPLSDVYEDLKNLGISLKKFL